MFKKSTRSRSDIWIFGTMLAFGIIGLIVSFILSVEEIHLIKNPDATLSCSINLVLNCSTVMQSRQASVFGFPNMLIGLMAYPVVITTAVVALTGLAGKLPRWYWRVATVCYGLGALFAYWLFFQSLYVIQVLCPWCLVITFSTTILFATIVHYALRENIFGFNEKLSDNVQSYLRKDYGKMLVAGWIVLLIALVILKFGDSLFA
ncbi:vitamin K epoxide reductase family protein [Streptomyces caniscabiei]|uniref:vitamin K epoxide reductase family protein n=1 Tax=Streptomyces caniscabiei TaxID=2746961 RepID=UPI0029AE59EE|nr:vitamin K epoxide reductase family protein [Streptomyces caniscabiei]MDX2776243.1 vitamin K epoxide reductase family protein [Streptomyces caniscabiei]